MRWFLLLLLLSLACVRNGDSFDAGPEDRPAMVRTELPDGVSALFVVYGPADIRPSGRVTAEHGCQLLHCSRILKRCECAADRTLHTQLGDFVLWDYRWIR